MKVREKMKSIIMAEYNDARYDARVLKSAGSLSSNGYRLQLLMYNSSIKTLKKSIKNNVDITEYPYHRHNRKSSIIEKVLRIIQGLGIIIKINFYIISNKADIYHLHNLKFLLSGIIAKKLYSACLVYDAHELHSAKRSHNYLSNRIIDYLNYVYEKSILNSIDIFIQASYERAEYVKKRFKYKKEVVVIENFVVKQNIDENKYYLHDTLGMSRKKKIILYVGGIRLNTQRRFERVISILHKLDSNVHFALIGRADSHDAKELSKYVSKCNMGNRVHLLAPVPNEDLINVMNKAIMSIIPIDDMNTLNYKYSAFNKLSETCMAQLPVAASDYPNMKKIILDNPIGPIGEVFNINNDYSLISAINRLIDPRINSKCRANAKKLRNRMNWEYEEKKLITAYDNMLID